MRKRKRSGDQTQNGTDLDLQSDPHPPDNIPCSSGTKSLCEEKSSNLVGMDSADASAKLSNVKSSPSHHHSNIGQSIFLKRPRHYFSNKYTRRSSGRHAIAPSTSHGKSSPCDHRLSFKLAESKEKAFSRRDRIGSSSSATETLSPDALKTVCAICHKLLRRKPYFLGDTPSSGEYAVIAVLVCGHFYHADCLEERTRSEDRQDPPCPLCLGFLSQDASEG